MREILFRGKREVNNEWVFGSLLVWPDGDTEICALKPMRTDEMGKVLVHPETVGQYTGLTDKNGKKIFEADIIKADNSARPPVVAVVKFGENYPTMFYKMLDHFLPGNKHLPAISFYAETKDEHQHLILLQSPCVEVIGNIHDNPELLGGADNG